MFRKTAVAAGVAAAVIGAALTFNSASAQFRQGGGGGHFSGGGTSRPTGSEAGAVSPRAASAATASPRHASISAGAVLPPTPSPAAASPDRASVSVASAAPPGVRWRASVSPATPADLVTISRRCAAQPPSRPIRRGAATARGASVAGRGGEHRGWFARQGFHRGNVGWAGPVFWPYAYDDLFDYAFEPYYDGYDGDLFWAYGYDDLFAGVLLPYAVVSRGMASARRPHPTPRQPPRRPARRASRRNRCRAALRSRRSPTPFIRPQTRAPNWGALKTAEENAEKTLAASCATQTPATAEGRLDVVNARLQAMVQASDAVRGPLNDFYSSLSDEQKAAFNALGQNRNASTPK